MHSGLLEAIKQCLSPSSVHAGELRLKDLSLQGDFLQQLLELVPNQESHTLVMLLSTLKNYVLARYNDPHNPIPNPQKQFLRDNLFGLYYAIKDNQQAVNLYKQIIYMVIAVDYPWAGVQQAIERELKGEIVAAVYFFRQVAKVNEWFTENERQPLEIFIGNYFPRLEFLVQQSLSNYNQMTAVLLQEILKTFYSAFHTDIPQYLRDFANIERWLVFFEVVMNAPLNTITLPNKQITARIYLKFLSFYCSDLHDSRQNQGWGRHFRETYALRLYQQVMSLLAEKKGDSEILSTLINCLHEVVKEPHLRVMLDESQCHNLVYGLLIPISATTQQETELFNKDGVEYVRREEDLNCYPLRRSAFDVLERIGASLSFGAKSQLMKMLEYSAEVLENQQSSDAEKEVVLRLLTKIGKLILKNHYLKGQFQNLTVRFFVPILKSANSFHNALICELLSLYLPYGELSNQTVTTLMELIYDRLIGNASLVVRFQAILAFTALLNHKAAHEAARPHFQAILQVYIEVLNNFDHQALLGCLESIVKYFSTEIVSVAMDLFQHLLKIFYEFSSSQREQEEDDEEGGDNSKAKAALSTIKQILQCDLSDETYLLISHEILQLLRGIFTNYNNYFDEILTLFNVLVYRARSIVEFEYPYVACRVLLEGNGILENCNLPSEFVGELLKAQVADSQFEESLVSIIKNLIQKMPEGILLRYPFPQNQQLLLCIIENKRISPQSFGQLNTSQVNQVWSGYLTSYAYIVYGIGQLTDPRSLKLITGVSLFPWLRDFLTPDVVKIVLEVIEEEELDDECLEEENTAQLLAKYANEQDDEEEEYNEASGANYTYLYDSPYDSGKDRQLLVFKLKQLSQEDLGNLARSLPNKYSRRLETLLG